MRIFLVRLYSAEGPILLQWDGQGSFTAKAGNFRSNLMCIVNFIYPPSRHFPGYLIQKARSENDSSSIAKRVNRTGLTEF